MTEAVDIMNTEGEQMTRNFLEMIQSEFEGAKIEAVVIGDSTVNHSFKLLKDRADQLGYIHTDRHVVLSWEEARPMLNYEFDVSEDVYPDAVYIWTSNRVYSLSDDASGFISLPRAPGIEVPVHGGRQG